MNERGGRCGAPEHLERHIDDLLRGARQLAIGALLRWHNLTQLRWKPRHLSRMLRHQRERFDIQDEPIRCANEASRSCNSESAGFFEPQWMVIPLAAEVTTAGSTFGVTRFFNSAVRHEIPVVLWFS